VVVRAARRGWSMAGMVVEGREAVPLKAEVSAYGEG